MKSAHRFSIGLQKLGIVPSLHFVEPQGRTMFRVEIHDDEVIM